LIPASWRDIDRRAFCASWLLLTAAALGCHEPVGHVSGTVTFEGQPLPAGDVLFSPEDTSIVPAYGALNKTGHYQLTRAKNNLGAVPAKYRVTVLIDPRQDPVAARQYPIPPVCADPNKTPLIAEVLAGENTLDFDLQKDR
jgi:hypothetical protein